MKSIILIITILIATPSFAETCYVKEWIYDSYTGEMSNVSRNLNYTRFNTRFEAITEARLRGLSSANITRDISGGFMRETYLLWDTLPPVNFVCNENMTEN